MVKAVIIKARHGSYDTDGWGDEKKDVYNYSFKANKSIISYKEKANRVLINQPLYLYPLFLFLENKEGWEFEGIFSVSKIEATHVVLDRGSVSPNNPPSNQEAVQYQEGELRYVTHLMSERSKGVVAALKETNSWLCEICNIDFNVKYSVPYIEAHHKTPISTYTGSHAISINDFALLCPNCHRATHIYMKNDGLKYDEIKEILIAKI